MKRLQYFLACTAMLVTTLASASTADEVTFELTGGCGCQNKKRPIRKPQIDVENDVGIINTACPCNKKKPLKPQESTFMLAGCGCQQNNERVQRRPLPEGKERALYNQMAKIAAKNRKFVGGKNAPANPSKLNFTARGCDFFGPSPTFAVVSHYVKETDSKGSLVTVQDGTTWGISESDHAIVKSWPLHTELAVKPNSLSMWNKITGTKPAHKFRLVNLQTNQSVAANMALGPFKYSPNTRKIERIDYSRGEVYLNNGSIWKVDLSGPCAQILRDWQRGYAMICGSNDTWFSLGSPFILISVEKENWLPATRIF